MSRVGVKIDGRNEGELKEAQKAVMPERYQRGLSDAELTNGKNRLALARTRMSTEAAQLAPAAGAGIGKLLADALLAQPGFAEMLRDVAMRGLNARTAPRWDKEADKWIDAPDYRVQVQTLALILAHMEGEPIKRVIHQHLGGQGAIDPLAALQASEALRDAARRLLEKAEWHKSGRAPKQAETVLDVS